jgi:hypothetical protein
MKVAIIGAGWLGCHLALKLREKYQVVLYEADEVFSQTSYRNQNRLHLGFHYARNSYTRTLCKQTFAQFLKDYDFLTSEIKNNIYAVPNRHSLLDFDTYLCIFDDFEYEIFPVDLENIQGAIRVNERYVDPFKAKRFFEGELQDVIRYSKIEETDLGFLSSECDLVINCTNNQFHKIENECYEEDCEVLLYDRINNDIPFDALTMVDGDLYSIFPYKNNTFTVTDVGVTPSTVDTKVKKHIIEKKILENYPNFLNDFEYKESFFSTKVKPVDDSPDRVPKFRRDGKVIDCFTGKIQGIYAVETYVRRICGF